MGTIFNNELQMLLLMGDGNATCGMIVCVEVVH
jgi:hypothetical protein